MERKILNRKSINWLTISWTIWLNCKNLKWKWISMDAWVQSAMIFFSVKPLTKIYENIPWVDMTRPKNHLRRCHYWNVLPNSNRSKNFADVSGKASLETNMSATWWLFIATFSHYTMSGEFMSPSCTQFNVMK